MIYTLIDGNLSTMETSAIFTIGHSNHNVSTFLKLLADKSIQVVVDVRSAPYSRYVPWFNKRDIDAAIQDAGLIYIFMGDAIGGKPIDLCYTDSYGKVDYRSVAASEKFRHGIERLKKGLADGWKIVLMCAEEDPVRCHRHQLIAKELVQRHHITVLHIRKDGSLLLAEDLLKKDCGQSCLPLFQPMR